MGAEPDHNIKTAAAAGRSLAQPERVRGTATELYDSGALRHMSPFHQRFLNYKPIEPRAISAANKCVFYAVGTSVADGSAGPFRLFGDNKSNKIAKIMKIKM